MHRSYYGRRRQWRLGTLVVIFLLITVFLVSCMAGDSVLWVRGFFGFDSTALAAESAIRTLDPTGILAARLSSSVMGIVGESERLEPFTSENEAVTLYRGRILNSMLLESYATYTGNREWINEAQGAYPHTSFVTLIPKEALEARLHSLFGGSGIGHRSDGVFRYLDRVGMYTTALPPREREVTLRVEELVETEHTYRMRFTLTARDESHATYTAVFQKDGENTYSWRLLFEET